MNVHSFADRLRLEDVKGHHFGAVYPGGIKPVETANSHVVCARCSYVNPPESCACNGCGVAFRGYAPIDEKPSTTIEDLQDVDAGHQDGDDLRATRTCPSCRTEVKRSWRFCEACAYDLETATHQTSPASARRDRGTTYQEEMQSREPSKLIRVEENNQITAFSASDSETRPASEVSSGIRTHSPDIHSSPEGVECRKCGASIQSGLRFCGVCGAAVKAPKREVSARISRRYFVTSVILTGVLMALIGGVSVYWIVLNQVGIPAPQIPGLPKPSDALVRLVHDAISEGDFKDARDWYHQLRQERDAVQILAPVEADLLKALTEEPEAMLSRFYDPPNPEPDLAAWKDATQRLVWAIEIKPNDQALAARANYCAGRVAYLRDQKDEALTKWKLASDDDPSWALPTNGVGLIYRQSKNCSKAFTWYDEAGRRDKQWALPDYGIGHCNWDNGEIAKARAAYAKAIEKAPLWSKPHVDLGDIARKTDEDYATAKDEYEKGLNLTRDRREKEAIETKLKAVSKAMSQLVPGFSWKEPDDR